MGNEQSGSEREDKKVSQAEVQRLLNEQRRMYERKCQQVLDQAKAESARNAQANRTPPPPYNVHPGPHTSQPASIPQPYVQLPNVQQPTHFVQQQRPLPLPGPSFERQRAPYNYAREDLQAAIQASTAPAPNLYPNLNNHNNPMATFRFENRTANVGQDFVFVDHSGPHRARPSAPSRDRSASRPRHNNNENDLKCPTCKMLFGIQIYQCNGGHSSCKTCKEQNRCCGICGNNITSMRNFALEGYVADQKLPCVNNTHGCTLSFKKSEMDIHCKECPFNELECPLSCSWKGRLKQLSSHFNTQHPGRTVDVTSEMRLANISADSENIYLIVLGAFHFVLHVGVSVGEQRINMTAQLVGTKVSATKWSYEVQVYNKGAPRRKVSLAAPCSSYAEPRVATVLPLAHANTFAQNGALTYKIYIKKDIENRPRGDFGKNQRGRGRK